jgi:hypothetical protein
MKSKRRASITTMMALEKRGVGVEDQQVPAEAEEEEEGEEEGVATGQRALSSQWL